MYIYILQDCPDKYLVGLNFCSKKRQPIKTLFNLHLLKFRGLLWVIFCKNMMLN